MANSAVVGILKAILTLDTAEFTKNSGQVSKTAEAWTKDFKAIGQQATALGSSLTKTLTLPIAGAFAASSKAAMDFESSFAGVKKTVDGTDAEFAQMAQAFRDLAKQIPINVNELNRLGEAAGALGIPKAEIVDFARVMALLGVTTDLTADQAAESIAKIQNIFGAAGKDTERFASALVALGNDGASTESQILSMATRIAGAGSAINLTQGEVLAFASALSSVGLEAEAGGTAISRVFIDMAAAVNEGGNAVAGFAKVAGQPIQDFAKLFKDDAAAAVLSFVDGLGKIKAEGGNLLGTLEALGFSEIRVRDTLLRTAGASGELEKALRTQSKAWQEMNALSNEARERFKTTESQITLLWNRVKDLGITLGNALLPAINSAIDLMGKLLPIADGMAKAFAALPGPVQLGAVGLLGVAAAAGPLLLLFGQLAFAAQSLTAAFGAKGIAMRLMAGEATGLIGTLGLLGKTVAGVGVAFAGWQVGSWLRDVGAMGEASETASQRVERLGMSALTLGERAEFAGARLYTLFTGNFVSDDAIMEAIVSRRMALEHQAKATDQATESTKKLAPATEATAVATSAASGKSREFTSSLDKQKEAQEKAKKAAEEAARVLEQQERALSALGIVTEKEVNAHIRELTQLEHLAANAGVPLVSSLEASRASLVQVALKAKEAGIEFKYLTDLIADYDRQILELKPLPESFRATQDFRAVSEGLKAISLDAHKAASDAALLTESFHHFGLQTPAEIQSAAREAKQHFEDLKNSGVATAEQIREAYSQMTVSLDERFSKMLQSIEIKFSDWGNRVATWVDGHLSNQLGGALGTLSGVFVQGIGTILTGGINQLISLGIDLAMKGLAKLGGLVWDGLKAIGSAIGNFFGGLFKGEGAKTNDTRDDWMASLGGLEGAHGLIAQHGNDKALMDAFNQAYFADDRNDFGAGAAAFNARLAELSMPTPGLMTGALAMPGLDTIAPSGAELPEGSSFGGEVTVQLVQDGRKTAQWLVPYIPEEVFRLELA